MIIQIEDVASVGALARRHPTLIALFEALEIDYACKGGRTLRDAAAYAGHDPHQVLELVRATAGQPEEDNGTLAELIHQIITDHHKFASDQARVILKQLNSTVDPPEDLRRITRIFRTLSAAIDTHMLREERQLFPPIEALETHPHRVRFGSMSRPLLAEFVEHDLVHEWLVRIRELSLRLRSANYPHLDVLDAVDTFDRDAHRHMHLENNVLIPRVVEMENRLKTEHEIPLSS